MVFLCGIAVAMLYFVRDAVDNTAPTTLSVAVATQPMSGLIFIAYEEGFFAAEGLDVKLIPHRYGTPAIHDLIAGKVDVATAAEMPFIVALSAGHTLTTLATIESSDKQNLILARRDRGIERPRDLIGKRVGVVAGTSSEVFLDAFLINHMIPDSRVERVSMLPDAAEQNLENGFVDAISTGALPGHEVSAKLQPRIKTFAEDGLSVQNWFLLIRQPEQSVKQQAYVKLLRALLRAEEFEAAQPKIAQKHVARHLGVQTEAIGKVWDRYNFNVGLHQYVLTNLETHLQLMGTREPKADIDFSAAMFFPPLHEVDADRVTVIH